MPFTIVSSSMPLPIVISSRVLIGMVGQLLHAGFPSPADDFIEEMIDLTQVLVPNPISTFHWRVAVDSIIDVKIFPGDVVLVDRSITPKHSSIVLAIIDGEPTLKRLNRRGGVMVMHNENVKLPPFTVTEGVEVSIWGVVTRPLVTSTNERAGADRRQQLLLLLRAGVRHQARKAPGDRAVQQ